MDPNTNSNANVNTQTSTPAPESAQTQTQQTPPAAQPSKAKAFFGSRWFLIPVALVAGIGIGVGGTILLGREEGVELAEETVKSIIG